MRVKLMMPIVLLSCLSVVPAQSPTVVSVTQADLPGHTFEAGQLKLTIEKIQKKVHFPLTTHPPSAEIWVKIENQSESAAVFDPGVLSLLQNGTEQVDVYPGPLSFSWSQHPVRVRKILPGAVHREAYYLDQPVELPARLFYDGKELAVITE